MTEETTATPEQTNTGMESGNGQVDTGKTATESSEAQSSAWFDSLDFGESGLADDSRAILESVEPAKLPEIVKTHAELTTGIPESASDYELHQIEGVEPNDEFQTNAKTWMHEAKLTGDQAKLISQRFNEFAQTFAEKQKEAQEKEAVEAVEKEADACKDALMAELKTTAAYSEFNELAERGLQMAVKITGDNDFIQTQKIKGNLNDVGFNKLMHFLGKAGNEDFFETGSLVAPEAPQLGSPEFFKEAFKGWNEPPNKSIYNS